MPATAQQLRVLICEREYLLALDMATELEREGAAVAGIFQDPNELLAGLEGGALDCNAAVLTVMPEDSGFAAAVALLQEAGATVVLSSGYPRSDVPQDVAHLPFFSKPINAEGLIAFLRDSLAGRSERHTD